MKTETTTTENITLAEFIAQHGITMAAKRVDSNRHMPDSANMDHWLCSLKRPTLGSSPRSVAGMRVTFSMGRGHRKAPETTYEQWLHMNGERPGTVPPTSAQAERNLRANYRAFLERNGTPTPPDVASMLDCLASDAYSVGEGFADFCANYGYDEDSRKAYRTFRACQRSTEKLKAFLGADALEQLTFRTERL